MEYRKLGDSGLNVPVLSFGTATFGGTHEFLKKWGATQVDEAKRMVKLCMDAGINLFDTANVYSTGMAEEILGAALEGLRKEVLISTKATFPMGNGHNDYGSSRLHLTKALEDSLRRLKTDYVDIYHMHGFDNNTPIEETLQTLDGFVKSGRVRYIAASNFSGWHLMKSMSISEKYGLTKYVGHQAYYSLANREFEWELMPLGVDQNVGTLVWSPLAGGRLSGKIRRGQAAGADTRIGQGGAMGPQMPDEQFYNVVDVLDAIAKETGKTIPQVALNWLLQRPSISTIVVGARNEEQLKQNFGATGWNLNDDQIKQLDAASEVPPIYPYWHQRLYPQLQRPFGK